MDHSLLPLPASRIGEHFSSADAFRDAVRAAVASFAYEQRQADDKTLLLRAPGHNAEVAWSPPAWWRPFKTKRLAVEGYEAPTLGLTSFILRNFSVTTMYDAGASHGFFSLIAAGTVGKSITAHAFEMSPYRYQTMLECIDRNGKLPGKVVPHLAGLSERHEGQRTVWFSRMQMFETKPEPEAYREALHRRLKFAMQGVWDRDRLNEVSLQLTSVDHFAAEAAAPPDFIKIDVDGYEGLILKGAETTLRTTRPFVLLELHDDAHIRRTGWSRRSIAAFLFDLGYSCLALTNHYNVSEAEVVAVTQDSPLFDVQNTMMFLFY